MDQRCNVVRVRFHHRRDLRVVEALLKLQPNRFLLTRREASQPRRPAGAIRPPVRFASAGRFRPSRPTRSLPQSSHSCDAPSASGRSPGSGRRRTATRAARRPHVAARTTARRPPARRRALRHSPRAGEPRTRRANARAWPRLRKSARRSTGCQPSRLALMRDHEAAGRFLKEKIHIAVCDAQSRAGRPCHRRLGRTCRPSVPRNAKHPHARSVRVPVFHDSSTHPLIHSSIRQDHPTACRSRHRACRRSRRCRPRSGRGCPAPCRRECHWP